MNNKYTDVGIALGTIADHIRANGGTPVEIDFHAVLTRLLEIAEKQAVEIAARAREGNRNRRSGTTPCTRSIHRRADLFGGRPMALACFSGGNLKRDGEKLLLIALRLASQHRQYLLRI